MKEMKPRSNQTRIKRLEQQAVKLKDSKPPKCEGLAPEYKRPSKGKRAELRAETLRNQK